MNTRLKSFLITMASLPVLSVQLLDAKPTGTFCNRSGFYGGVSVKLCKNKFDFTLNDSLKTNNERLSEYIQSLDAFEKESNKYKTSRSVFISTIGAGNFDTVLNSFVGISVKNVIFKGRLIAEAADTAMHDLCRVTIEPKAYDCFNLYGSDEQKLFIDRTAGGASGANVYRRGWIGPPPKDSYIPAFKKLFSERNSEDTSTIPVSRRFADDDVSLHDLLDNGQNSGEDIAVIDVQSNDGSDRYTANKFIKLDNDPENTIVTDVETACKFLNKNPSEPPRPGASDNEKLINLGKNVEVELSESNLKRSGYNLFSTLSFLELSGNGLRKSLVVDENYENWITNQQVLRPFTAIAAVNNLADINQNNNSSIQLGDAFTQALKGEAWASGLKGLAEDKKLEYTDGTGLTGTYPIVKNMSVSLDGFLGYRASFGDISFSGEIFGGKTFVKNSTEVKDGTREADSDKKKDDNEPSGENNENNENNSAETNAQKTSDSNDFGLTIQKKWNMGVRLGLSYYINRMAYVGIGCDIFRETYEIKTNKLGSLYIASPDSVHGYLLNKMKDLGVSDMTLSKWNESAVATGIGKEKLSVSAWGVAPFVTVGVDINENVSTEFRIGYAPSKNIIKTGDNSIGHLKVSGFDFGVRLIYRI